MNRRNVIGGLIASTTGAALLPGISAAKSIDARQREALRLLVSMPWQDGFNVHLLHVSLCGRLHDYAVELLDSGLSVNEIRARLAARAEQLDGGAA